MRKVEPRPACVRALVALLVLTAGSLTGLPSPALAADSESADAIIAAQLKRQGYACTNPRDAEEDATASKPDQKVWTLRCDEAAYRVRLVPDMAAEVERIE